LEQEFDKQRYKNSMARLQEIFAGISDTVTKVSLWRCPYKDVEDRCTAGFGCRNQDRKVAADELLICTGDDNLDYRGAWKL
jgi:hypothetical protein